MGMQGPGLAPHSGQAFPSLPAMCTSVPLVQHKEQSSGEIRQQQAECQLQSAGGHVLIPSQSFLNMLSLDGGNFLTKLATFYKATVPLSRQQFINLTY